MAKLSLRAEAWLSFLASPVWLSMPASQHALSLQWMMCILFHSVPGCSIVSASHHLSLWRIVCIRVFSCVRYVLFLGWIGRCSIHIVGGRNHFQTVVGWVAGQWYPIHHSSSPKPDIGAHIFLNLFCVFRSYVFSERKCFVDYESSVTTSPILRWCVGSVSTQQSTSCLSKIEKTQQSELIDALWSLDRNCIQPHPIRSCFSWPGGRDCIEPGRNAKKADK